MTEEIQFALDSAKEGMDKALRHLDAELLKVRAGKAHPAMLDSVKVDYYGTPTPIGRVANINSTDARTLVIQPWERNLLDGISTAIINANLGLNPMNNGEVIMINVPALTEERRRDLMKRARAEGEHAKVGIRNARKEAKADGLPEDAVKVGETKVQDLTDAYIRKVDEVLAAKEADVMTV